MTQAIHGANPKCLVGCQLGASARYGGPQAALTLFEAANDFAQIYAAC